MLTLTCTTDLASCRIENTRPSSTDVLREKRSKVRYRHESIADKVKDDLVRLDELGDLGEDELRFLSDDPEDKEIPIIVERNEKGCFSGGRLESDVKYPASYLHQYGAIFEE